MAQAEPTAQTEPLIRREPASIVPVRNLQRAIMRVDRTRRVHDSALHDEPGRRAERVELGLRLYRPLRRFVGWEIIRLALLAGIDPRLVVLDDVIAALYLGIVDESGDARVRGAVYPWLRQLARREAEAAVSAAARQSSRPQRASSSDESRALSREDGARLVEALSGCCPAIPYDLLRGETLWPTLAHAICDLEEESREVFLLSLVDRWSDDDISVLEGIPIERVYAHVARGHAAVCDVLRSAC